MRVWGDATIESLDRVCKQLQLSPEERANMLWRWRAQYRLEREAYLETLPEISRMGRMIWIHARRHER